MIFWNGFLKCQPKSIEDFSERKFHFSRISPGDSRSQADTRHEHYLFGKLNLRPGMKVLAIGGGFAPAQELAQFSTVDVTVVEDDKRAVRMVTKRWKAPSTESRLPLLRLHEILSRLLSNASTKALSSSSVCSNLKISAPTSDVLKFPICGNWVLNLRMKHLTPVTR